MQIMLLTKNDGEGVDVIDGVKLSSYNLFSYTAL